MELRKLKYNAGAHIGFDKTLYSTISNAIKKDMFSVQLFLGSPYSIKRATITDSDFKITNKIVKRFPINIYTHFPYIANFAGKSAKNSLAWDGNISVDKYMYVIIKELEKELNTVSKINGKGVVIHPGSYPDREAGLNAIIKTINKINFKPTNMLLLENCAGEGNKLCKDFYELSTILKAVNSEYVGVCLDTAHIWGAGIYDLSHTNEVIRMFEEFDNIIGLSHLKLIHINDSAVKFGSKVDRHAEIGSGFIWKNNLEPFNYLRNFANENNIPMILESDGTDIIFFTDICLECSPNNIKCC